jgi:hypothetical protein
MMSRRPAIRTRLRGGSPSLDSPVGSTYLESLVADVRFGCGNVALAMLHTA